MTKAKAEDEKALLQRWAKAWEYGAELNESERRRRLWALTEQEAWRRTREMWTPIRLEWRRQRESGLLEQQRLFRRLSTP